MDHQEIPPAASELPPRGRPAAPKSLTGLFTDLFRQSTALLSGEIALARQEINSKVTEAEAGAVSLGIGYTMLACGFLILLFAAVFAAEGAMPPWAAALLVGGGVFIIGLIFMAFARHKLRAKNLAPRHTAASLRRDGHFVKEHM